VGPALFVALKSLLIEKCAESISKATHCQELFVDSLAVRAFGEGHCER